MATYTENYNLKMPSGQDAPDVEDFNTNAEIIDTVLKAHSDNTADEYSPDETYTAGRLVIKNNALWKAKQDINVAEAWTPEHWEGTTLAAEFSAVNSRFTPKFMLTQNRAECSAAIIGDVCALNLIKTPNISPGGNVIIGNVGTDFAGASTKMLIGDRDTTWESLVVVAANGDVSIGLLQAGSELPNAFYKGSCVIIKNT